jgi:hypothetical protein
MPMPRLAGLQTMLNIALAARSRSAGRYWENFFIGRAEKGHPLCRWQVLETVRKLGLEGVVGKRIDSCYEPGERSKAWIKLRTNMEQEFVIGGYIPGTHKFDALLVGIYDSKEFIFVAKVKNGFVPRIRDEIFPAPQGAANCPVPHAAA